MSELKTSTDVVFFFSVLYRKDIYDVDALTTKINQILKTDFKFVHDYFPMKDYYSSEMGESNSLGRFFLLSKNPMDRKNLIDLKIKTTKFEIEHAKELKRTVNLDVGFIGLDQVVLATGKPYYHRIYLDQGVWANLELFFQDDEFKIFPWSYPDYSHPEIKEWMKFSRGILKAHF